MNQQLFSIFLGIPTSSNRKVFSEYLSRYASKYERFVIPCAGRFVTAQLMVKGGIDPKKIVSNDITLFSSALGYYIANKDVKELGIEIVSPELDFLTDRIKSDDPVEVVAATMLAIKIAQLSHNQAYYFQAMRQELLVNWQVYMNNLKESLQAHKKLMEGIEYTCSDARDILAQHEENEKAFIYHDPPTYKKGYEKMFDVGKFITWKEPTIQQITPDESKITFARLRDAKACVMVNTTLPNEDIPPGWLKIYAGQATGFINHLLVNRAFDPELKYIDAKFAPLIKAPYALYGDQEITKNSKVQLIALRREEGEYYRDMFVHRFGSTSADNMVAFMVDGRLLSITGIDPKPLYGMSGKKKDDDGKPKVRQNYVFEMFGMTIPSGRYKRLRRLYVTLLSSTQFRDDLVNMLNLHMLNVEAIRTSCFGRIPTNRSLHGLFKKQEEKKQKDGMYHMVYETPFHQRTYKECIVKWLDENRREETMKKVVPEAGDTDKTEGEKGGVEVEQ